jgi:hypothetical protein
MPIYLVFGIAENGQKVYYAAFERRQDAVNYAVSNNVPSWFIVDSLLREPK